MKNNQGFTLIEVLIALTILAISLTAISHATNMNITNSKRLHDLTIANWVMSDALSAMELGVIKAPTGEIKQRTTMADDKFEWQANINPSQIDGLNKLKLTVEISPGYQLDANTLISAGPPWDSLAHKASPYSKF